MSRCKKIISMYSESKKKPGEQDGTGSYQGKDGKGQGPGRGKNKEKGCEDDVCTNEVGPNDDLDQALKRADRLYKRDMGARELITWVTKNYTDRVIHQFVDKYQDKLLKRAKEEEKATKNMVDYMLKTLKKYPDLQK